MAYSKKPFKDRAFYLDVRFYRHQEELVKNLKKLGGKIESFLSREVTHVITDRPNLTSKAEPWVPSTPKSVISSPSPINYCDSSVLGHFETPANTSSSPAETVNSPALSRGLALVQKAKQKNQGTTDLLGVCTQWGIKVVQLKKVLSFITKYHLSSAKKDVENHYPHEKSKDHVKHFVEKLSPPFIKFEDEKQMYKPHYKVFRSWKDICDPTLWRVFNQLQMQSHEVKQKTPLKNSQIYNMPSKSTTASHLKESVLSQMQFSTCSPSVTRDNSSRITTTIPVNYSADKMRQEHNRGTQMKGKLLPEKKKALPKKRYCEICQCTFINLDEHVMSKMHRDFVNDSTNFLVLKGIISSLPSVTDFLQKHEMELERDLCFDTEQCQKTDTDNLESAPVQKLNGSDISNVHTDSRNDVFDIAGYNSQKPLCGISTVQENALSGKNDNISVNTAAMPKHEDSQLVAASCSTAGESDVIFPYLENNEHLELHNLCASNAADTSFILTDETRLQKCMTGKWLVDENNLLNVSVFAQNQDTACDFPCDFSVARRSCAMGGAIPTNENVVYEHGIAGDCAEPFITFPCAADGVSPIGFPDHDDCPGNNCIICNNYMVNMQYENGMDSQCPVNTNVLCMFPFTNFGFGWSGNSACEHVEACADENNDVPCDVQNAHEEGLNVSATKGVDDICNSSENGDCWKEIRNGINNVCKSLDVCEEEEALDLSMNKSRENSTTGDAAAA